MEKIKTPYEISLWKEKEQLYYGSEVVDLKKITLTSIFHQYHPTGGSYIGKIIFYKNNDGSGNQYEISRTTDEYDKNTLHPVTSVYIFPSSYDENTKSLMGEYIPCYLEDGTEDNEIPSINHLDWTKKDGKNIISNWDNIVYFKNPNQFTGENGKGFEVVTDNYVNYSAYSLNIVNYLKPLSIIDIYGNAALKDADLSNKVESTDIKKINYTIDKDNFITLSVTSTKHQDFNVVFSPFEFYPELKKGDECYIKIETKINIKTDPEDQWKKFILFWDLRGRNENDSLYSYQPVVVKNNYEDEHKDIGYGILYSNGFYDDHCVTMGRNGTIKNEFKGSQQQYIFSDIEKLLKGCVIFPIDYEQTLNHMKDKNYGMVLKIITPALPSAINSCSYDIGFRISACKNFKDIYTETKNNFNNLNNKDENSSFGYSTPFFKYFDEEKVCIIGSNTMEEKNKAINPRFVRSLNGISTLTFSMYKSYWDDKQQDFIKNPFIDLLVNEAKIKLKKDNKWFDFIIKSKEEDSEQNMITYTCKDYHATTLSKQGYNTELSKDLFNNQGTIKELTDTVLKESDWIQDTSEETGTETILEKSEETLYKVNLFSDVIYGQSTIQAHRLFYNKNGESLGRIGTSYLKNKRIENSTWIGTAVDDIENDWSQEKLPLRSAATVYMHYSDIVKEWKAGDFVPCYINLEKEEYIINNSECTDEFKYKIVKDISKLKRDGNDIIDDWNNIVYFKYSEVKDPILSETTSGDEKDLDIRPLTENGVTVKKYSLDWTYKGPGSFSTKEISNYRSKKVVNTNITKYIPELEEYVNVYKNNENEECYSFTETEYVTPDLVRELMVNGGSENGEEGITSDSGWMTNNYQHRSLDFTSNLEISNDTDFRKSVTTKKDVGLTQATRGFLNITYKNQVNNGNNQMHIYNSAINSNKELIKTFTKGDEYIIELEVNTDSSIGITGINPTLEIREIEFTSNGFTWAKNSISEYVSTARWYTAETEDKKIDGRYVTLLTYHIRIKESITEAEFKARDYGLHIYSVNSPNPNYDFRIYRASFYKKVEIEKDEKKYILGPDFNLRAHPNNWRYEVGIDTSHPGKISKFLYPENEKTITSPPLEAKLKYNIYKPSENEDILDKENLKYIYQGYKSPEDQKNDKGEYIYTQQKTDNKIRNIEASKSNTFNILQSLSEIFGCWCRFRVEHEKDGRIKLTNPPYHQEKYISFHNFIGQENPLTLRKRINTKNIQRTIESDTFVTKLIVPDNIVQQGQDGICSISRADDNISNDNVIYDLSYYIRMNLLPESTIDDLNSFLERMGSRTTHFKNYTTSLEAAKIKKTSVEANYKVWDELIKESAEKLTELKVDFEKVYKTTAEKLQNGADEDWNKIKDSTGKILDDAKIDLINILTIESKIGSNTEGGKTGYYLEYETMKKALDEVETEITFLELKLKMIAKDREQVYREFTRKYNLYLQEGTWSSSNYIDDNLYYLDARQTLAASAKPQISYSISAIDLTGTEEYQNYVYEIGDRTTIEDTEFFGWVLKKDGNKYIQSPYQENVIISEISQLLDDASQNTYTIQNYRTQFEDLFQKMAAETQNLQYKEGSYDNAAAAVGQNGQILPDAITNTFNNSSFIITHAKEQGLTWTNEGITATNQNYPNLKVNIKGGVIRVSKDSGATWQVSITGNGINANTITTGVLNAGLVNIQSGGRDVFTWSDKGIVATLFDEGDYDFNSKITLNQYGLFGGLGDGTNLSDTFMQQLANIHKNSRFALTWKGFSLKTGHANSTGYVSIDSDDDITLNVKPTGSSNYLKIIQIGHLESTASTSTSDAGESAEPTSQSSESGHYGIRVKDMAGNVILETTEEHVNGRFHINCGVWSQ